MSAANFKLVVVGNVVELQACGLYHHSHPMIEYHHVCPESWWVAANKPVQSPLFKLCPNCHYGIHVAIDAIIKKQDTHLLHSKWVEMAQQAFTIATANGLTPALTL